jgi:hypothetical protein
MISVFKVDAAERARMAAEAKVMVLEEEVQKKLTKMEHEIIEKVKEAKRKIEKNADERILEMERKIEEMRAEIKAAEMKAEEAEMERGIAEARVQSAERQAEEALKTMRLYERDAEVAKTEAERRVHAANRLIAESGLKAAEDVDQWKKEHVDQWTKSLTEMQEQENAEREQMLREKIEAEERREIAELAMKAKENQHEIYRESRKSMMLKYSTIPGKLSVTLI